MIKLEQQLILKWLEQKHFLEKIEKNRKFFVKILQKCLKPKDEKVLIIGDYGYRDRNIAAMLSACYYFAAKELGLSANMVFQNAKLRGENASKTVVEKLGLHKERNIIIVNMSNKLGKLESIGLSFRRFCKTNNHRFVSTSSLGDIYNRDFDKIIDALNVDYDKLKKKHDEVKRLLDEGSIVEVKTKAGTDFSFSIRGMKAISADGIYTKAGEGGNLPAGEVYIPPRKKSLNGEIVIDGSSRLIKGTLLLYDESIILKVENGKIIKIEDQTNGRLLESSLRYAEAKSKFPWGVRRIGEFGIGLNPNANIIGSTIIDEKSLGTAHVAIGSNYWFGGDIYAIIHLDQIFRNPIIKINGRTLKV